jgi:hypothetical protein
MGYREVVERERELLNNRGDFFTNWLGLPVSLAITRLFIKFNFSENLASLLMWFVGISGSILLAFGSSLKIIGLMLIVFHYILDYVDGQLAREHKTSSVWGAILDRWSHFTVQMTFYCMLAIGLYRENQTLWVFVSVFIFIFWNQFRNMIANIPVLIYFNELSGYHEKESRIIYENYLATLQKKNTVCQNATAQIPEQPTINNWRAHIRSASTSFDFFVISLLCCAVAEAIISLMGWNTTLFLYAIYAFAVYYLFNFIDYSKLYLFSDRIYLNLAEVDKKLASQGKVQER